uniref:keratin-associated protein 5-1-like n=1 Tax=Styela clava TaxID=7725 RepID=UPI001939BB6A|nr:keratin-associated protein 5-1-like [Styela clava]
MKYFLQFAMVLLACMKDFTLAGEVVLTCPDPDSFGRNCITFSNQCENNDGCSGGKICCLVAGCGLDCVDPIMVDLCPAADIVGPPCNGDETNECTDTPTNTGTSKICCYSGCSRVIADDPRCEAVFPPGSIGTCASECGVGKACPMEEICCSNGCGTQCVQTTDCPGGIPIFCVINACDVTTCATHTGAECRSTCNGCVANFFDKFDNEIADGCECPFPISTEMCSCDGKTCPNFPDAECRKNICGECSTDFFDKLGKKIENCEGPILDPECPEVDDDAGICIEECQSNDDCEKKEICCSNGCGTVCKDAPKKGLSDLLKIILISNLFRPQSSCPQICIPCSRASCPGNLLTQCRGYCNGCLPRFFNSRNHDVTSTCSCPRGLPGYGYCSTNPCLGVTCYNYPYAECRVSSCGGCHAEFFDSRGRRIYCTQTAYRTQIY